MCEDVVAPSSGRPVFSALALHCTALQVVIVRRDTGVKESVPWEGLEATVQSLLTTVHADMLAKARTERDERIAQVTSWEEFMPEIEKKKMVLAPWCDEEVGGYYPLDSKHC